MTGLEIKKTCKTCQVTKSLPEFRVNSRGNPGKECKKCFRARRRRLKAYDLDPETYKAMVLRQGGLCAVCLQPPGLKGLMVDHDHSTGRVRGLLCTTCNTGLGMFMDDPELLRAAIKYLAN